MSGAVVEIPQIKWESQRKLGLDKGIRDAVADMLRRRYPTATAKSAARDFKLTVDRAREAVAGRASLTTVEQIIKQGGPPVALPIIEAVWGGSLSHYFTELRKSHADQGKRLAALFGDDGSRSAVGDHGATGPVGLDDDSRDAPRRRMGL